MKRAPLIETARLKLRGIRRGDAPAIVAWRSMPENYRYFRSPHALTMDEHLRWFEDSYLNDENRCDWMAFEKATEQPLGVFGLVRRQDGSAEANYLLDQTAQGKGYAAEALCALLEYAKAEWGISAAAAEIHKQNEASLRFAARMGFAPTDELDHFIIYRKEL